MVIYFDGKVLPVIGERREEGRRGGIREGREGDQKGIGKLDVGRTGIGALAAIGGKKKEKKKVTVTRESFGYIGNREEGKKRGERKERDGNMDRSIEVEALTHITWFVEFC